MSDQNPPEPEAMDIQTSLALIVADLQLIKDHLRIGPEYDEKREAMLISLANAARQQREASKTSSGPEGTSFAPEAPDGP